MTEQATNLPWSEPGWLAEASDWVREALARQGITLSGPIEQPHVRPWSTVLMVPADAGRFFFKATAPALGHEPALTRALAGWRPDCMPQVLAVEPARGWMLMADGGQTLRSVLKATGDLSHWRRVLPLYAELQIEMAARVPELLALGAFDRRLSVLPSLYAGLLADTVALRIGRADGLSEDEYRRLTALTPKYAALCGELAAYGVPHTLQHDDFHDGNIFVNDRGYVFFDWAESCVAHPFFTLVVTLRNIAWTNKLADDASELAALRDAYLEPWTRYAPHAELLAALRLALRVGTVSRALTWHRALSGLPADVREPHAEAVPGWLQEFLA
jgi:hypothetical protein